MGVSLYLLDPQFFHLGVRPAWALLLTSWLAESQLPHL